MRGISFAGYFCSLSLLKSPVSDEHHTGGYIIPNALTYHTAVPRHHSLGIRSTIYLVPTSCFLAASHIGLCFECYLDGVFPTGDPVIVQLCSRGHSVELIKSTVQYLSKRVSVPQESKSGNRERVPFDVILLYFTSIATFLLSSFCILSV